MPEPEIVIIVHKVLQGQVNETCVMDQDRDRRIASVILIAEYFRSVFAFTCGANSSGDSLGARGSV